MCPIEYRAHESISSENSQKNSEARGGLIGAVDFHRAVPEVTMKAESFEKHR